MRILQVSDVHGNFAAAERVGIKAEEVGAELILVVGDITHFGDEETAEEVLGKVAEPGIPILFVSGNCDPPELLNWKPERLDARNLHGSCLEFRDWRFIGVGGGIGRFGTLTELSEEEIEKILNSFPKLEEDFVLVSHSPPYGLDVDFTGTKHIGSKAIKKFIEERQPILVSCGHAHEGRDVVKIGRSTVVNAGPAKNGYCAVIELERDGVEAELSTLY